LRGLVTARWSLPALHSGGATEILPTGNRSVLGYRRAHPRSGAFLSLTNFSDVAQQADAGVIARAGLRSPRHARSTAGELTISGDRIELPAWGFVWLADG
jgi:amylosucrase